MDMFQNTLTCMTGAMMADTEKTARHTEDTAREIASLRAELEQARQDLARYKAEQREQRETDSRQVYLNTKKAFRHDYCVGAFSVVITLAIEHLTELYNLLDLLIEFVGSLLH